MKNFIIASFMLGSAVTANAGAITYVPPQAAMVEEPARMGGSGGWIVPLVIVAVVALALASNSCNASSNRSIVNPTPTPPC